MVSIIQEPFHKVTVRHSKMVKWLHFLKCNTIVKLYLGGLTIRIFAAKIMQSIFCFVLISVTLDSQVLWSSFSFLFWMFLFQLLFMFSYAFLAIGGNWKAGMIFSSFMGVMLCWFFSPDVTIHAGYQCMLSVWEFGCFWLLRRKFASFHWKYS